MSCPLCRHRRAPRHLVTVPPARLVRCRRCGLVRVSPMPAPERALAQYDADYFADGTRGYVDYVSDEPVFRREFRRRLQALRGAGARGALLDVGCATGALLDEARHFGFEASGLEPSLEVARLARARTGRPVQALAIEAALLHRAHYGAITLHDVLEHVTEPVAVLRKLRAALAPGGVLSVTVPDYGGWWARVSGRYWPMITPWEHLLYFTRRTLRVALREAGFAPPRFVTARTPLSARTVLARIPGLQGRPAPAWPCSLPFGTIHALVRVPARTSV